MTRAARPAPRRPPAPSDDDAPPPFAGFADAELDFFRRLERHQDRAWFAAHKAEYEEGWALPMAALLHEVRAALDGEYPYVELAAPKVFRIQRDTRFAKDKSPYKTNVAGVIATGRRAGDVTEQPAAFYFSAGLDGVFAGAGQYVMAPPALARFRAAVADEARGGELGRVRDRLAAAGFTIDSHESLKSVPRGFDPAHPRADLLRRKGLVAMHPALDPSELTSRALVDRLIREARMTVPLVTWLVAATAG